MLSQDDLGIVLTLIGDLQEYAARRAGEDEAMAPVQVIADVVEAALMHGDEDRLAKLCAGFYSEMRYGEQGKNGHHGRDS